MSAPDRDELVHREQLSPNYDERALPITMAVIHYTEMESAQDALDRLRDPEAKVSAHYLISREGEVTRLVPEAKRAWHAGVSYWRGIRDVNSASIGIELDHPGHKYGYCPFPDAQFEALVPLLARMVRAHRIPRANVVGHSDVAPQRKIDPGDDARPARDEVGPAHRRGGHARRARNVAGEAEVLFKRAGDGVFDDEGGEVGHGEPVSRELPPIRGAPPPCGEAKTAKPFWVGVTSLAAERRTVGEGEPPPEIRFANFDLPARGR